MSHLITFATCSGCFPVYQPNQLAHSEPGGCLWCASAEENNLLTVEAGEPTVPPPPPPPPPPSDLDTDAAGASTATDGQDVEDIFD